MTSLSNPYLGPAPFSPGQDLYGRERETTDLANLLISKRTVLLFSPSGAGKTSLLQAALLPRLAREYGLHTLPIISLAHQIEPAALSDSRSNRYLIATLRSLELDRSVESLSDERLSGLDIPTYYESRMRPRLASGSRPFYVVVFDQFEELFTLDSFDWDTKQSFLAHLGKVLGTTDGSASPRNGSVSPVLWTIFSMREDYVAELEPFLHLLPTGLGYRYRLDPLERDGALEAVVKPAAAKAVIFTQPAAEVLVDDLRSVRTLTRSGEEQRLPGRFIEPLHLQLTCLRLWEKVVRPDHTCIDERDLAPSGYSTDVDDAITDYLESEIKRAAQGSGITERALRDWMERELVKGGKLRARALLEPSADSHLHRAVEFLRLARVLTFDRRAGADWMELAHDRLVEPLLRGNARWRDENLLLFQRQSALWARDKTATELLFTGDELEKAEQFARASPEQLTNVDEAFIRASREQRERIKAEQERTATLELKNNQIKKQEKWLVGALAIASVIAAALVVAVLGLSATKRDLQTQQTQTAETNERLNAQILENARQLLKHASTMATAGRSVAAASLILEAGKVATLYPQDGPLINLQDRALVQTLAYIPPIKAVLGEHSHVVRALAFADEGKLLISGGWDRKIKVWRADGSARAANAYAVHNGNIYDIASHELRKLVVTVEDAGLIVVWRAANSSLDQLASLNGDKSTHKGEVTSVTISPDGELLASGSRDGTVALWDLKSAEQPRLLGTLPKSTGIYRLRFLTSSHGYRLASADTQGWVRVWAWDLPTAQQGGLDAVKKMLDGLQARWQGDTKKIVDKSAGILALSATADGRWLAVGTTDGNVVVWDTYSGPAAKGVYLVRSDGTHPHSGQVFGVAFSPDGRTLVSVGYDQLLLVWRTSIGTSWIRPEDATSKAARPDSTVLEGWSEPIYAVAFHPVQAGVIALGGKRTVLLADLQRPLSPMATKLETPDRARGLQWTSVQLTPDSLSLGATCCLFSDGKLAGKASVHLWRRSGPDSPFRLDPSIVQPESLYGFALDPGGKWLATASCRGKVELWELSNSGSDPRPSTLLTSRIPQPTNCPPSSLVISGDGAYLAFAFGKQLFAWSSKGSQGWEPLLVVDRSGNSASFGFFPEQINALAFSPKNDQLVTANEPGKIRFWRITRGSPRLILEKETDLQEDLVVALTFSADGRSLLTAAVNSRVTQWEVPSLTKLRQADLSTRRPTSIHYRHRGGSPVILGGDISGVARVWFGSLDDESSALLSKATSARRIVLDASADGNSIVTASDQVLLWDLRQQSMLSRVHALGAQ